MSENVCWRKPRGDAGGPGPRGEGPGGRGRPPLIYFNLNTTVFTSPHTPLPSGERIRAPSRVGVRAPPPSSAQPRPVGATFPSAAAPRPHRAPPPTAPLPHPFPPVPQWDFSGCKKLRHQRDREVPWRQGIGDGGGEPRGGHCPRHCFKPFMCSPAEAFGKGGGGGGSSRHKRAPRGSRTAPRRGRG